MRIFRLTCVYALLLALTAGATAGPPQPEPSHPPQKSVDFDAARSAFEALSEADRKATQEALGWLGFYNGVFDGAYGKRTIEALAAWQRGAGATGDGIATTEGLAALKAASAKARAAVGFRVIDDAATGIRIGAPTKLLDVKQTGEGATSLVSKDGEIGLYLKQTSGDLAALFKEQSADAGERHVTYKAMKAGVFFVTAGEERESKFYRRYAVAPDGKLRGFAFVYPKARAKALDPVAIALANGFDPAPATPLAAASPAPDGSKPATTAPATPTPVATAKTAPEGPKLTATALVIAPGVAVSALDPAHCKAASVAGAPVQVSGATGGLARLTGAFGAGVAAPVRAEAGGELVALSFGPGAALTATSAQSLPGGRVLAALGPTDSGAPLFDRRGRLVGFVATVAAPPRRAGLALAAPWPTIPASALGEAGAAGAEGPALSAAEIARLRRDAVVGVFCGS